PSGYYMVQASPGGTSPGSTQHVYQSLFGVRENYPQPGYSPRHRANQPNEASLNALNVKSADRDWEAYAPAQTYYPLGVVSYGYLEITEITNVVPASVVAYNSAGSTVWTTSITGAVE